MLNKEWLNDQLDLDNKTDKMMYNFDTIIYNNYTSTYRMGEQAGGMTDFSHD